MHHGYVILGSGLTNRGLLGNPGWTLRFLEVAMALITMTREMATLGTDVAAGPAERLGLEVVHHELVEHDIAKHAGGRESELIRGWSASGHPSNGLTFMLIPGHMRNVGS